ncbi:MAG TPA: hypothetical protein VMV94_08465 [Phycisphaerae bacterium]|nr:hypothetical protein [Phycisphaerae bacterium]
MQDAFDWRLGRLTELRQSGKMFIMMRAIREPLSAHAALVVLTVLPVMVVAQTAARGDAITITQWDPGVLVNSPFGYDDDGWTTVENPCHRTLFAQAGSSVSSSTIDFAWAAQSGTFLIESQQAAVAAASGPSTITSAPGFIRLTTTEPMPLSIDASWTFDLPAWWMRSTLLVSVYGYTSHTSLFSETTGGQTSWPGGFSNTVTITADEIVLPPGETWVLRYDMNIYNDCESSAYTATGSGYVNFQITPEPATLFPLALALFAVPRRRHRPLARP